MAKNVTQGMQPRDKEGRALCMCGCGMPVPISRENRAKKGYTKGAPRYYIPGHSSLVAKHKMTPPNPDGYCMCGCGGKTAICTNTNQRRGNVLGEHLRFMRGHNTRRPSKPLVGAAPAD